jgi:2-oxo-hept-3-ene-1,7-dioate hydratase
LAATIFRASWAGIAARMAAGEIVLAGSFSRPVEIRHGDTFHADYGSFGSVSCQFI